MRAETIEDLQKDWPGWKLWRTETMWNATRRGLKPQEPAEFFSRRGHLVRTILEDSARELAAALENQAAIEAELTAFLADDHSIEHPIIPACPIACLALQQGTEDALVMHWRSDGQYAPTIRDLLQLREDRDLTALFGISYSRAGEIDRKLKALELVTA
ncbi:hypothetical protein [Actinocorallia libanotica]|uniref:DUF5753 domain-containing protein n=1 Tax=Actinocorallia libanotica TaxID=46162 RepID=A0ABN1RZY1_9ACTN